MIDPSFFQLLHNPESGDTVQWPDFLSTHNMSGLSKLYPTITQGIKQSPTDLDEAINNGVGEIGATIYILEKDSIVKYATNSFYLIGVQFAMKERMQIQEAFESANITFFDEATRVYTFSGVVVEQESSDRSAPYKWLQQSSLLQMYNDVLRGSKLVERGAIAVLKVKNHLVYGYPFQLQSQMNGNADKIANFNLGWIVTDHTLAYTGIATEQELAYSYTAINNDANKPYIIAINEAISKIDDIINFDNWAKLDNSNEMSTTLKELGVAQFGALSYNALMNINNVTVFVKMLNTTIGNFKKYLTDKVIGTSSNSVSPLIKQFFKDPSSLDEKVNKVLSSTVTMFEDGGIDKYLNIVLPFIKELIILKNSLLTFQSRLVY